MTMASMKELLEAGVHFGHYTRRWNPKMRPYIFTERNGIHILDLAKTVSMLDEALEALRECASQGGTILFVGTKKQAMAVLEESALRCNMPFITERWLGGMLTNWTTIRKRIQYLHDLEARRERGEFAMITKREALLLEREIEKLNRRLGGIKDMVDLPDMLFIVDTRREHLAVNEANKLGIPVVAVVDTNCDPDPITYVIPSNDDAIRALKLMADKVAAAIEDGKTMRESSLVEEIRGEDVDTSQRVFDPFDDEGADTDDVDDDDR